MLRPGHIVSFRQRFYVVGPMKVPIEKNGIIKFSAEITELQNPFISLLLSTLGQQKVTQIGSGSLPTTVSAAATGLRSGSTVVYSLETFATEGSSPPSGVSINSSTGLITATGLSAGVYDVRAIVTDTHAKPEGGTDVRKGWGRWTLVVT
jgi:hypothetical protein